MSRASSGAAVGAAARRTRSAAATESLAARLAPFLAAGDVIALSGALGAGKTRFVAGLARGLGAPSRVRSPSFTLVNEYTGRIRLLHLDLYRLEAREAAGLGIEDLAERGALAVEWGEKLPAAWRAESLEILIERISETGRRLTASARGGRGLELLGAWRTLGEGAGAR